MGFDHSIRAQARLARARQEEGLPTWRCSGLPRLFSPQLAAAKVSRSNFGPNQRKFHRHFKGVFSYGNMEVRILPPQPANHRLTENAVRRQMHQLRTKAMGAGDRSVFAEKRTDRPTSWTLRQPFPLAARLQSTCRYRTKGKPLRPALAPVFSDVAGARSISLSCGIRAS